MNSFHKQILELIKVPVERISFRKDKWGELVTVYFAGKFPSVSFGDDHEDIECFYETVKQGSRSFVFEAERAYGKNWRNFINHRELGMDNDL